MGVIVGVASAPQPQERRVALVPELVKKYEAQGAQVLMAAGAAKRAHWADEAFPGVEIVPEPAEVFRRAQLVLCVQPPLDEELALMPEGSVLVGALQPWASRERVERLLERRVTAFALELLPRISRAQSMDILSSQATVAGYEAALIAADHSPKFFPMLTYAAGTIRPAKVLVIGAGVAGLQAIATARRLGAAVEAYDVRPETREQVESLGAKFLDTGVRAVGEGGYARELTEEEKAIQAEKLGKAVGQADALITTASIPGRPAPRIITAEMIARMRPGAVVVDLAAETGGNVEGTVPGEKTWVGEVLLIGPTFVPSRMPVHASEMFSKNVFNFVSLYLREGSLALAWDDEVLAGTCMTHAGELKSERVRQWLGL